jgi:putative phosphoribosyl transferase
MFRDRNDAGLRLAEMVVDRLTGPSDLSWADRNGGLGTLVLGLPRGGVPVAALVADALGAPLDVLVVRKIGVPGRLELALGAVGEGGAVVLNDGLVAAIGMRREDVDALVRTTSQEVEATVAQLRGGGRAPDVSGRVVIVVDDGLATGATARAAASTLRSLGSKEIILATPIGAPETCASLRSDFDEVLCLETPRRFGSVGQHYRDFAQVSLGEVRRLLAASPA